MSVIQSVSNLVKEAESYAGRLGKDRVRAVEYYQGLMKDTPSDSGRSSQVTKDLRSNIKKVLPSIIRTILNADQVVEFLPNQPEDDRSCQQATDYINQVVLAESGARNAIYDGVHDALLLRNGIIKWWYEEKRFASVSSHSGLTDDEFAQLAGSDDMQVLEHTAHVEVIDQNGQQVPMALHDCKVKRITSKKQTRVAAVPRERFLIHPDAVTLEDSLIVGEKTSIRRSDLVAMGYERDRVMKLPVGNDDDYEETVRRADVAVTDGAEEGANEEIDFYDIFVRIDADDDGIAELHHMTFAGGLNEENLLEDEECDDVQFCDIAVMRNPHQWEGVSLADDLMDLQRVKTVLLRQTLDNIYWQNNPQPIAQGGAIKNMDAVYNPEFGLPIEVNQGVDVRAALGFNQVPFVASNSFGMLEYMDKEAQNRTGVSDASSGLAPDALQNMTAKASAMIEQQGIGQTEMMVRTVADGLKKLFKGLLKLTIKHQDVPRTVRLRNEWVQFDPRDWNAEMDCTVNTGLGAGTRERDMMVMQQVMMVQEKLLQAFGPDNPYVKPEQVYNATAKLIEASGLKTVDLYFTKPDPQEVQQKLEALKNAPHPDQMKVDAQAKLEQAKAQATLQLRQAELQMQMQMEQAKMQASTQHEKAQMDADLQVKQVELQNAMAIAAQDIAFRREELNANIQLELTKLGLVQDPQGGVIPAHLAAIEQRLMQLSQLAGLA